MTAAAVIVGADSVRSSLLRLFSRCLPIYQLHNPQFAIEFLSCSQLIFACAHCHVCGCSDGCCAAVLLRCFTGFHSSLTFDIATAHCRHHTRGYSSYIRLLALAVSSRSNGSSAVVCHNFNTDINSHNSILSVTLTVAALFARLQ